MALEFGAEGGDVVGEGEGGAVMVGEVEVGLDRFGEGSVFLDDVSDVFVFKLLFEREELAVLKATWDDEAGALGDAVEVDEFGAHGVVVAVSKNFRVERTDFFILKTRVYGGLFLKSTSYEQWAWNHLIVYFLLNSKERRTRENLENAERVNLQRRSLFKIDVILCEQLRGMKVYDGEGL